MAQLDYFLKIDGVDGESTDDRHKGEIQLTAWSFGAFNAASLPTGGGGGSGKVTLRDLQITKKVDKASVRLFLACCTGERLKTATLFCRKAGKDQQEFFRVILSSVAVGNFSADASDTSVLPQELVTFNFARIEIHYAPQNPDGTLGGDITGGWDVLQNRKI